VRVLDPAVGSGAFPLGMLALLVGVRRALYRIAGAVIGPQSHLVEGWKRNFIRDCLYGVDIKREAIEIARLRLWLALVVDADPFDMEPLPNLDYKLMDGNSLIETFEGIAIYPTRPPTGPERPALFESAAQAQIRRLREQQEAYFQPDLSPQPPPRRGEGEISVREELKRQIRETEFAIVKETLTDRDTNNTTRLNGLLQNLANLQGRTPPRQLTEKIAAIRHDIAMTQQALADLRAGKPLPFFLFRLHFASVFQEKDGFNIVIANPPYVRHERIAPATLAALRAAYPAVQHGMADLYVYFYARALELLHDGGTLAFISSNKFFRAGYGKGLRDLLTTQTAIRTIIDFGDAPVFDAAAYPCIVITTKGAPAPDHTYRGLTAGTTIELDKLGAILAHAGQTLPQSQGAHPPSSTSATSDLVAKLMRMGTPLGQYANGKMYRGVVTGLNEVFVIDQTTRDQLIAENPRSAEVLKPFLRGRDIGRYAIHPAGRWLISTRRGIDITQYPAIERYLSQFRQDLQPRPRGQTEGPGRKPGTYQWYEIQDSVDYYGAFDEPKIVYPDIASRAEFSWDESGAYCGNTAYFLPTTRRYLTALLNSNLIEYVYASLSPQIRGGFFRFISQYMEQLPIVEPALADQQRLAALVDALQALGGQGPQAAALEREVDAIVYRTYGLTAEEIAEVEGWHKERLHPSP
jgi:adenine-specific DNA-methyltransferase